MKQGFRLRYGTSRRLTEITAGGATGRGPSCLCADEIWGRALDLIARSEKIAVISGFYIPSARAPETDGPPGAVVLARALSLLGRDVEVWTDSLCHDCFRACGSSIGFSEGRVRNVSNDVRHSAGIDLFIYVERPGRASDGAYYNMRREDITRWSAPLDRFALEGSAPVLAIGDGGNEVGMGSLAGSLADLMPRYAPCLCVVGADVCIPVDVSNWGAYALVTAMSFMDGRWLGQSLEEDVRMLESLSSRGAVDGVTGMRGMSVDGLEICEHLRIRAELEGLLRAG
ncbi:MAG: DUF4392 domain-containing protein [Synergistaceae bacterium]|nr:DUF4392 domain-containing protein [Synergistaceae bacterium]